MIHVSPQQLASAAVVTTQPRALTPARYLALRRSAAGMSINAVAVMIAANKRDLGEARDLIALLETPGAVARRPETIDALRNAFPFDPDVYRQLASEPAERHPRVCHACGCSAWDPHVDAHGIETLDWADEATCTRCDNAASIATGRLR
ncbi:hypothetical protein [Sphingomonas sp.]|uniref:hypothetical protein n=1 Tax=Sphingomonas sp. TaxID=28214 RepID=UPI0026222C80|nr:hypothetical protein [Sphingomonas sp.]MDF2602955.1 hypothetical protein [Sphingomonas sp.]